ncbi:MAG TPA: hypothetical protein VFF43_12250, partial [Caldimonas sp.]|nr:hypothetical protein [Caldimonas sp.]
MATQLFDERGLGCTAKRTRLTRFREIEEGPVLGHDRIEHAIDVGANAAQIGKQSASDQQDFAAGVSDAGERLDDVRQALAAVRDGAVVVAGEDVNVHEMVLCIQRTTQARLGCRTACGFARPRRLASAVEQPAASH